MITFTALFLIYSFKMCHDIQRYTVNSVFMTEFYD